MTEAEVQKIKQELKNIREKEKHLSRVASALGEHDLADVASRLREQAEDMIDCIEERHMEHDDMDALKGMLALLAIVWCFFSGLWTFAYVISRLPPFS